MITNLCGCEKPCGCGDDVVTTPLNCTLPECNNPEKCSETFSSDCVIYTGDTIANLGITKGMNMSDIIQLFTLAITNSGCIYPTSPCLSVVGVYTTNVTSTIASIIWNTVVGATGYQVEYRPIFSASWISNPVVTTGNIDNIGMLVANTDYYIRIKTICASNTCYSNTILIKTKNI